MEEKKEIGSKELWNERQLQAVHALSIAFERMRQERISEYDILFWVQNFLGPYLKLYGLSLYVGTEPGKAEPILRSSRDPQPEGEKK